MAAATLTKSYVGKMVPSQTSDNRVLFDIFKQAGEENLCCEYINLQTMERTTSNNVLSQANKYAKGLISLGLSTGLDCVAVIGCVTNQTLDLWVASTSVGIASAHPHIFVPREHTITKALNIAKPSVVFVGGGCGGEIISAFVRLFEKGTENATSSTLPTVKHVYYEGDFHKLRSDYPFLRSLDDLIHAGCDIADDELDDTRRQVRPDHIAHMMFTSGSTGFPKCAQYSQRYMARLVGVRFPSSAEAGIIPNYHNDIMSTITRCAFGLSGNASKLVICPDKSPSLTGEKFAERCCNAIIQENVTNIVLTPQCLELVSEYMAKHHSTLRPMKLVALGGQSYSRGYRERLQNNFGGMVATIYGMSECNLIAQSPFGGSDKDEEDRMECRLSVALNTEIRLVDSAGNIVDIGEEGEIQVKSPGFFSGYRDEQERTNQLYTEDGFFRTGDVGVMFQDGRFEVKGRRSDAIRFKVDRKVVWPAPIENVMSSHPNILDIRVVSCETSNTKGDELVYCIRLKDKGVATSIKDILEYCREKKLFELQLPSRVIFFETFPHTGNERKVDLRELRNQVISLIEKDKMLGVVSSVGL